MHLKLSQAITGMALLTCAISLAPNASSQVEGRLPTKQEFFNGPVGGNTAAVYNVECHLADTDWNLGRDARGQAVQVETVSVGPSSAAGYQIRTRPVTLQRRLVGVRQVPQGFRTFVCAFDSKTNEFPLDSLFVLLESARQFRVIPFSQMNPHEANLRTPRIVWMEDPSIDPFPNEVAPHYQGGDWKVVAVNTGEIGNFGRESQVTRVVVFARNDRALARKRVKFGNFFLEHAANNARNPGNVELRLERVDFDRIGNRIIVVQRVRTALGCNVNEFYLDTPYHINGFLTRSVRPR